MAEEKIITLTEERSDRLDELLRNVGSVERPRERGVHVGRHVAFVTITSTTKVEGRYPAKLQFYNVEAKTWSDGPDVWVVEINESP